MGASPTESWFLARKRHETLELAPTSTYAKEPVFEATEFEIRFNFPPDMSRQAFTLVFQLLNQGRVVFLYKLVEQRLLWAI